MLSTGIKNAILVLLLVLILHVLIKNALLEKNRTVVKAKIENFADKTKEEVMKVIPETVDQKQLKVKDQEKDIAVEEKFVSDPECLAPFTSDKDETDELLKYVYGNEGLNGYFKGLDVTKEVKDKIDDRMECKVLRTDDKSLPLSTTCDPGLQKTTTLESLTKKVKADCNLDQSLPLLMLKQYEDESSMNGGEIYGNLSAYDNLASNFENYSCSGNM